MFAVDDRLSPPLSSEWEILRMLFVRGFGMAFLFVPINSSILSQFKEYRDGAGFGIAESVSSNRRQYWNCFDRDSVNEKQSSKLFGSQYECIFAEYEYAECILLAANGMGQKMSERLGMASGSDAALKGIVCARAKSSFHVKLSR